MRTSIRSAVFAELTVVINRQTYRYTDPGMSRHVVECKVQTVYCSLRATTQATNKLLNIYSSIVSVDEKNSSFARQNTCRTFDIGDLVVPRTRQRIGDRAFSVAAPRAWNRLLTDLKLLRSFRRQLKAFCSSLPMNSGIQTGDCFVMRPRSPSRGRNTNTAVTVSNSAAYTGSFVSRLNGS